MEFDEGSDKLPPRPVLLLAKVENYWGWYARETHNNSLWCTTGYAGGALSVGDFQDFHRQLSDPEAVRMILQDVIDEKAAADRLGGKPHLPAWERY